MKLTKIFYGNQYVKSFRVGITKWQIFKYKAKILIKRAVIASFIIGLVYGSFHLGRATTEPVRVYADKIVEVEIKGKSPVMDRIAKCESGGSHIEKSTGQVVMRSNTNKSVDIGKYQINSVWFKKATELGFDVTTEKGNEAMAYWIYENRGTNDWYASKDCWSK